MTRSVLTSLGILLVVIGGFVSWASGDPGVIFSGIAMSMSGGILVGVNL
jgi:hypothetical protein